MKLIGSITYFIDKKGNRNFNIINSNEPYRKPYRSVNKNEANRIKTTSQDKNQQVSINLADLKYL